MTSAGLIVSTTNGPVCGLLVDDVELFVEVPYGASTAGANRFLPPQPPQSWASPREATTWTNRAPQNPDEAIGRTPRQWFAIQGSYYAPGISEDCLTLNVWTPSTSNDRRRPVLVWIHGGGFAVGHAASHMSDGQNMAVRSDVVFVSISHRLNAFGFLDIAALAGPRYASSGNLGLLDLIAGLEWVRDNIAAFGGDPGSVTVVGESGGGAKVSTLLTMPAAEGLIHRAVCESGVALHASSRESSTAYAQALIAELGGVEASALFDASTAELLTAQVAVALHHPELPSPGPVANGSDLPRTPVDTWGLGYGPDLPVLAGTAANEVTVFGHIDLDLDVDIPDAYRHGVGVGQRSPVAARSLDRVAEFAGVELLTVIKVWREQHPGCTDEEAAEALMGDVIFGYPTVRFAEMRSDHGKQTFLYRLDWASPFIAPLGACHSTSVSFFFDNTERVDFTRGNERARALATTMRTSLEAFMRTGSPAAEGGAKWVPYDRESRSVMIFDDLPRVERDPDGAVRDALAAVRPRSLM
ncbi:MAG: para-nitrobenzyl esterase [Frankiales bacterium]|jgi:para-nitrobenzyl esterase|nr:para-nitrobenzyl esterase [Frankiales bacterium]